MRTHIHHKKKKENRKIGSIGHLIPNGFVLLSVKDPIHIPSVLVGLTSKPESSLKSSSSLKRV